MALTPNAFKTQFPEFNGLADGTINAVLKEAKLYHSVRELATLFCAAHLHTLNVREGAALDGGSGLVESEQIGPKRMTFKNQAETNRDVFFATTTYGRRFLALEKRTPRFVIGAKVAK